MALDTALVQPPESNMDGGGRGGGGPSILGPRPERVYSHATLLELKSHPLARRWPPYLDPVFRNNRGVWDPDRWHLDRKRGETPPGGEDVGSGREGGRGARAGRAGGEGGLGGEAGQDLQQLVLSPQRRSFLTGCSADAEVSLRPEQPQPGKRVGSGRLLARPEPETDRGFRKDELRGRGGGGGDRGPGDRFGVFRGREREEERDRWGEGGGHYGQDRQEDRGRGEGRREREERRQAERRRRNEPEWMSEEISKSDVIELRGFDEPKQRKQSPPSTSAAAGNNIPISLSSLGLHTKPGGAGQNGGQEAARPGLPQGGINVEELEREQRDHHPGRLNNNKIQVERNYNHLPGPEINAANQRSGPTKVMEEKSFNYDQIMDTMNINSLLGGAAVPEPNMAQVKPATQSRFSQFFNKGSGVGEQQQQHDSRRSSIQDELLGVNILKEINGEAGPTIKIPSPSEDERHFAPISPAAQTRTVTNPLMDMLQRGGESGVGRAQDLEEGLRRQLGLAQQVAPPGPARPTQQPQQQQDQQDGLSAFKKLVAMMGHQQPPIQQEPIQTPPSFGPGVVRPNPVPASLPSNAPTEQEILEQQLQQHGRVPHSKLPPQLASYLLQHPLNLELLARPEAEQLLVGLQAGTITLDNIVQQLGNPALQQRQRDLLLSVLKVKTLPPGRAGGPGVPQLARTSPQPDLHHLPPPSRVSPVMFPHLAPPPRPPHLAVSPNPPQARVPSPQEMTLLTQQIMQQALLKRKLEEQKENFKKKHGVDFDVGLGGVGMAGPPPQAPASGSPLTAPLAFTPTSVMRRGAAERKDSEPRQAGLPELKLTPGKELPPAQQQQQVISPGRPITKAGQERPGSLETAGRRGVSPQPAFPPPHTNPLLYLQNNPLGQVSHSMLSRANAMAQQQMAANLMAHGLDPRQMSGPPGRLPPRGPQQLPPSPGHPQPAPALARFFSPDVLAAAQAGAVPAMPAMPVAHQQQKVLTLEEIERQAAAVKI